MKANQGILSNLSPMNALWLILGLAAVLRLWGIMYGLPHVYWTDEYHEVMRAMELGAGGFNLERTGKGGFYLLLFIEYGFYYVALKLIGIVSTTQEFAELFVTDPTAFYLLGRITAAVAGCATIGFVFLLARNAYAATVGLVAALFMAVNVLHVDLSHRVGVDVPMTLFVTMALYYGVRIANGGGRRDYVIAGLCAALATTTKLPGIVVLLPLLIAHGYNISGHQQALKEWVTSANLWIALVVFLVIWVSTNPGIVVASDFFSVFEDTNDELADEIVDGIARPNLWLFYLDAMRQSMGWPLALLSMCSVGYAVWRRTRTDLMLLSFGAANYIAICSTTSEYLYFPRYTLPIIVVLVVLAARCFCELAQRAPKWRPAIAFALLVMFSGLPLAHAWQYSDSLTRDDTRTLAKEWIEEHVPAGSKVLIEGGKISASRLTVPLEDSRDAMLARIEYWKAVEPRQAKYLSMKLSVQSAGGYDLELVKVKAVGSLTEYIRRGVTYFVIRPDFFLGSRKAKTGSSELVAELKRDRHFRLLQSFAPEDTGGQGPVIEIYQYRPDFTGQ